MTSKRQRTALLYKGTAFVNQPIGTEDCLRLGAASERLEAFYRKWYHPERMILVIMPRFRSADPGRPACSNSFSLALPNLP